jgi:hypothetical protein
MTLAKIVADIRELQRKRTIVQKSRIMQENRLTAVVAGSLGYESSMTDKDRKRKFKEAGELIDRIDKTWKEAVKESGAQTDAEKADLQFRLNREGKMDKTSFFVLPSLQGINSLWAAEQQASKKMEELAEQLPVAEWVKKPVQKGIGMLGLAIIIGEAGNLSDYDNPGKLWKRFGCAPFSKDGQTLMASTWRTKKNGLTAEDWTQYGYSPRRKSIAYQIGDRAKMQNGRIGNGDGEREDARLASGPYRARYDEKKAEAKVAHPDWTPLHLDRHAVMLAAKLVLKNLWIEWGKRCKTLPKEKQIEWYTAPTSQKK